MREGWSFPPLGDLLVATIGGVWGDGLGQGEVDVLVARSTEFHHSGVLDLSTAAGRSVTSRQLASRRLEAGDILLEKSGGGPKQPVGRVVSVEMLPDEPVVCSNFVQLLRPDRSRVLPRFLFLAMWNWHASGLTLEYQSQTTGIRNLRTKDYLRAPIALPPLDEQRRIVDLIDAVDAATAQVQLVADTSRAALLCHLDGLHGAVARRLGDLAEMGSGPSWKSDQEHTDPVVGSLPVIGITNTKPDGRLDLSTRKFVVGLSPRIRTLSEHSLILIRTNGNRQRIGNVYRAPHEAAGSAVSAFQIAVEPSDSTNRDFLYWALASPTAQAMISDAASGTTGLGNVAIKWLREYQVPWPGDEDRSAFVSLAESLATHQRAAEDEADALRMLRSSLLGDLLSGDHQMPATYDELLEAV